LIGLAIDYSRERAIDVKGSRMDAALAYLISVGIVAFGAWIVAIPKIETGVFSIWFVLGLLTIAVGLISLLGEIRVRRTAWSQ
jgi:uncharacterized membrane protein YiaA